MGSYYRVEALGVPLGVEKVLFDFYDNSYLTVLNNVGILRV